MATGKRSQSSKVGQTLQDLEAAFADWEALTDQPEAIEAPTDQEKDLKEKTKKLLSQLREQLAELED